jgi:hypothetical protein
VTYASNADLVDGDFSANLDVSALAAGDYRVWARGCLADDCGARSSAFRLVRAAPTCFEDDAAQLAYEPGWHWVEDADASAGHFRLGHGKGLSFSFDSEAAQGTLRYVFATSSKGGSAELYLDGQLVRTVSYRGESGSLRSPVFGAEVELPLTGAGEHTFELRNVEGAAYLDTICLSDGSSQAQPAAGPGPTSTNTGSVDAGSQLSQPLTVPSGTLTLAVLAESDSPLPYTLALLDATGSLLATTQSSPDGTASLQTSVTGSGPHLIQLLNPGLGHITFWIAATPHLAVR